jgi:hypothetical protein
MKKKYAPPPERDHLPAMFVGDELPAPAPMGANEASATHSGDLRVVTEGASMMRWVVLGPALLLVLITSMSVAGASPGEGGPLLGSAALCALLGWLGHRYAVKHRKELRLTDEGIVMEVRHRVDGEPRITRIPWTRMRVYTAVADAYQAFLYVVDDRGDTLTLNDVPARTSSQELIRRFVERAQRHGIAERPASQAAPPAARNDDGTAATEYVEYPNTGCGLYFGAASWILLSALGAGIQDSVLGWLFVIVPLLTVGLYLWNTLHDQDVADADRTPLYPFGYLRRWLRRVLNIHWET